MGKLWILLAICLVLTGCVQQPADPTDTAASIQTQPSETTLPTEPADLIDDAQPLNAVALAEDVDAIAAFGENLLLFRGEKLTVYSFVSDEILATAELEGLPLPGSGCLQICGSSILYFNAGTGTLVYLDEELTVTRQLQLSETPLGAPYLTRDGTKLYFCCSQGIRVWDIATGICQNLKLQEEAWLGITGAMLEETALRCQVQTDDGTVRTLLISTETGQTLHEGDELNHISGSGQLYCCPTEREWIFGIAGQQPQTLQVENALPLADSSAAITLTPGDGGLTLELYDLLQGKRTASVTLPGVEEIKNLSVFGDFLWFTADGQLWRWDPSLTPVEDDTVYTAYRYTAEAPDVDSLNALRIRADNLQSLYGLQILMWNEVSVAEPAGYTFGVEHLPNVYEEGFAALEAALANLPAEMPDRAADWAGDGVLRIVLVRSITTPSETAYQTLSGMEYLLDGNVYIVLELGDELEQTFYHALFHVIDPLILSNSIAYYKWNDLNPSGFQYDNDYIKNLERDGSKYLDGDKRWFIDTYSMSFAVEDRARIFECAMQPGNESYFTGDTMQKKLKMLCKGIREVFQLEAESYPWEQYLKK